MNPLSLLAVLFLAAAVSGSLMAGGAKNEQNGRFFFYKVKPRSAKDVENLLRPNSAFGSHPPIFLQNFSIGDHNYALIEQSKVAVFEKALKTYSIKFQPRGITLVDSITTRNPLPTTQAPRGTDCDCDYKLGGCKISKPPQEGFACKCIYTGFLKCEGKAFSCDPNQHCPANCSTKECCETGRGNCGGY